MGSNRRLSVAAGERPKDQTRRRIERMEAEREARRRAMQDRKLERAEEEQRNLAAGNPGDVDFIGLVRKWREANVPASENRYDYVVAPKAESNLKICICVRKRPVSTKERKKLDHDSVTCIHPDNVWVHSAKLRVDGITKYLDHNSFRFDYSFDENSTTEQVYEKSTLPLINFVCAGKGGRATVFAYGQTGSGKTHTMSGIQAMVAEDIFAFLDDPESGCASEDIQITVAFYELYGGRIQDLLNNRHRLRVLEDGKGEVIVSGLEEFEANDPNEFLALVEAGNKNRTTHATEANDTSSRSHAICQIILRSKSSNRLKGKLSLVDLAGSERGTDTKSHNRQRRTESSEINKSLLALKECIRALDSGKGGSSHVPYRASKLTLILKDCFTSKLARTTMIATVSPGANSADHTLNTLRYADRVKEKKMDGSSRMKSPRTNNSKRMQKSRSRSRSPVRSRSPPVTSSPHLSPRVTERSPRITKFNPSKSVPLPEDPDDIDILHASLRESSKTDDVEEKSENVVELHKTVQSLFEEEENLLNLHMSVIQENAELLTEEGRLLQAVQGEDVVDYDIDQYASRLGTILDRKTNLISNLQDKLNSFRGQLRMEEDLSKKVSRLPEY